jgi:hypothetical protein
MPVLIAAIEAVADPSYPLELMQVTTNPMTPFLLLKGPHRDRRFRPAFGRSRRAVHYDWWGAGCGKLLAYRVSNRIIGTHPGNEPQWPPGKLRRRCRA